MLHQAALWSAMQIALSCVPFDVQLCRQSRVAARPKGFGVMWGCGSVSKIISNCHCMAGCLLGLNGALVQCNWCTISSHDWMHILCTPASELSRFYQNLDNSLGLPLYTDEAGRLVSPLLTEVCMNSMAFAPAHLQGGPEEHLQVDSSREVLSASCPSLECHSWTLHMVRLGCFRPEIQHLP